MVAERARAGATASRDGDEAEEERALGGPEIDCTSLPQAGERRQGTRARVDCSMWGRRSQDCCLQWTSERSATAQADGRSLGESQSRGSHEGTRLRDTLIWACAVQTCAHDMSENFTGKR
jgi:hypothetical protein